MIQIRDLVVHKSLKVHSILIEPKRVKATYTIIKNDGLQLENFLIYSYDQNWFDNRNASDINLASMMVAQVALNYGLFFEKIIFDGIYDHSDRKFINHMMENTSREILVNKFFMPNEFLKTPYDHVAVEKMTQYTAAEIVFENNDYLEFVIEKDLSSPDNDEFVILSSGGKDSLLTYGIIKEIGGAHPVFINESGRHWFTAVNAYRYLNSIEPNTCKPWCNSDRIFNWMARQMPFIIDDFQNKRSDNYPLRLWTVSVFLFGALPIARKRNIANILVGNEYDTTVKSYYKGVLHFNALYDQSKYFDHALTRYYKEKGWNMIQFSILRSLSELLILKILVKRYPGLQKYQVSCHAAHADKGVMLPCGNCEKCRRIIGMLKALGEDPGRCGYTKEQIEKGLKSLSFKSVKQIGSDAAHLFHMMLDQQLIENNDHAKKLAKCHPEIMSLRFDEERSNLNAVPINFIKPLFKILRQYADQAVCREDYKWKKIDLDLYINNHKKKIL